MFVYSIAIDRNARLEYDDDGITMYTLWGKPIPYRWTQITKVDTALAEFLAFVNCRHKIKNN